MALGEAVIKVTADASGVEAGVGKAKKSLATLSQSAGQTSDAMAAANERTARSIDRFVAKQQLAVQTMGKSATEAKLFELAQRGASAAQLKSAESALRAVDAFNKQEAASARAQAAAARFGAIVAAGAAVAAAGIFAMGRSAINALDQFNDLADATGASIENISALDRVARENGQAFEATASILVRFNKVLTDTDDEGKKAAAVMKALGLDAAALKRLDPAEALRQTAVALAKFADDGDKARAVQLLFGKSVQEAAPFLKDLAEKTALVGTTSTQAAKEAETFNKSMFALKANVQDAARFIAGDLVQALNAAAKALKEGGLLEGFRTLFTGDDQFKNAKRLTELTNDLLLAENALAASRAKDAQFGDKSLATAANEKRLAAIKAELATVQSYRKLLESPISGPTAAPSSAAPSIGSIPSAPKSGSKKDPLAEAKQYLESLQKQLQVVKEMTVYEKLMDDIKSKRIGKLTPELQKDLEATAREVDLIKEKAKAEEDLIRTRERAGQMQQAVDDAALANVETQIQTNEQLRDEIELLGLEGQARATVEKARISSAIALKEEALIMAQNSEASATVISSLEREIALLKERQGLIGVRADKQEGIDLSKATEKEREKFAGEVKSDLSGAFQAAFRDTDNPIKAFAETLGSTVFERLSKAASDALADAFLKNMGGTGGAVDWVGFISGMFGGGGVTPPNPYYTGRAIGGPVSAGRMYRVNERGPEMLDVGGKKFLMMGDQGGNVTPGGGGGVTIVQNITTTDTVSKTELESKLRDSNRMMVAALDRQQRYARG